jgi:hypothetical protein
MRKPYGLLRGCASNPGGTTGMNALSAFGLFAVTAMVLCYAFEDRNPWFILGFAVSCVLGSIYGFLQGAWPFGVVEGIWSVIAARRWWVSRHKSK